MLVFDTTGLPSSYSTDSGAVQAVIANEDEATQAVQAAGFNITESAVPTSTGTINPTVIDGKTVTLPIPEGVEIQTLSYNGATYTLSPSSTPTAGTFTVDYDAGIITLETVGSAGITANTNFQYTGLSGCYPTPVYGDIAFPVPWFLRMVNATGTVNVSRSFQSAPSSSIEFHTTASAIAIAQTYRRNQEVDLWGCKLAIKGIDIEYLPNEAVRRVSMSLGSKHEYDLGKTVYLKRSRRDLITSVAELCRRAGAGYSGPSVRIRLPKDMPTSTSTTPGSEVESRAISERGFVFHSGNNIEIRRWRATSIHWLSEGDLLPGGGYSISYNGDGALVNGYQLAKDWRNVRIEVENEGDDGESGQSNDRYTLVAGDPSPTTPPATLGGPFEPLKITADVIWPGGPNKNRKTSTYENSSLITEIEETWGILISPFDALVLTQEANENGEDVYVVKPAGLNAAVAWKKVREVRTTYNYDGEGYLKSVETKGWEYTRVNTGDPSGDWVAYAEAYDSASGGFDLETRRSVSALYKKLTLYDFRKPPTGNPIYNPYTIASVDFGPGGEALKLSIDETTTYDLESMLVIYPDIEKPETDAEEDDGWIEPRYCNRKLRKGGNIIEIKNPESNSRQQLPPITLGKVFEDSESHHIIYPTGGISKDLYQQNKDLFKSITKTKNQEGKGLQNDLEIGQSSENKGRPSTHTRKETFEGEPGSTTVGDGDSKYKHLANTPGSGYNRRDPETGSFSAPGVRTIGEAKQCAGVQVEMDNLGAATLSGSVRPNTAINWEEGDILIFKGQFWLLTSLNETYKIQGCNSISADLWQFQAGILLDIPLSFLRLKNDNEEGADTIDNRTTGAI